MERPSPLLEKVLVQTRVLRTRGSEQAYALEYRLGTFGCNYSIPCTGISAS